MKYRKIAKTIAMAVMSLVVFMNSEIAYAGGLVVEDEQPGMEEEIEEEDDQAKNVSHSLGKVTDAYKYYKVSVKSPGMLVLKFTGLEGKAKATLVNSENMSLSFETTVKPSKPRAVYYVGKSGTYYFWMKCAKGKTANAKYTFTKKPKLGGMSYAKAEVLKKGAKKCSVLGFEASTEQKQYFKVKITKEQLVRVKITKGNSCSETDTVFVEVYKSNDKKNRVTWGWMYEGQGKGTLYIRNSKNHKTEPGTYYIVLSKSYSTSGFDYSLTWMK